MTLFWLLAWVLVTAAAVGAGIAVSRLRPRRDHAPPGETFGLPPRVMRPPRRAGAFDTNRNPIDGVPNGGRRTTWFEAPEVPRNDYLYVIGA